MVQKNGNGSGNSGNNIGSSTDNEDKSNGLDFKRLHEMIENYIPPRTEVVA
jgi:hypothetical protein